MTRDCLGPVPARKPRLATPLGACDCHAHILGPYDRHPPIADRSYTAPEAPWDAYRAMLDRLGIARAVIVQPSIYGTDNAATLAGIARDPVRQRGVAVITDDLPETALRDLHAGGIRGVRFNLLYAGGVGLDALEAVAARIAPLGWHVQLLLDARDLPELTARLAALPVEVVIDHMGHMPVAEGVGHPGFRALLRLMEGGRCWVKLSGNHRLSKAAPDFGDVVPFARALVAANPERCVWGSDWPHVSVWPGEYMPNDADLLDTLLDYAPDAVTRRRILADNPARLYDFPR